MDICNSTLKVEGKQKIVTSHNNVALATKISKTTFCKVEQEFVEV